MSQSASASSEGFRDHGVFLLRLLLGGVLVVHAAGSLLSLAAAGGQGLATIYSLVVAETIVGVSLLIGFQVRWVALGAVVVLLASAWLVGGASWLVDGTGAGREVPILLAVVAVAQFLLGDGRYAITRSALLRWRRNREAEREQHVQAA